MSAAAEGRRLVPGAIIAAADGRAEDLLALLADADRDALIVAVSGLAIAVGAILNELPEERRAALREQMNTWALDAAARTGAT